MANFGMTGGLQLTIARNWSRTEYRIWSPNPWKCPNVNQLGTDCHAMILPKTNKKQKLQKTTKKKQVLVNVHRRYRDH